MEFQRQTSKNIELHLKGIANAKTNFLKTFSNQDLNFPGEDAPGQPYKEILYLPQLITVMGSLPNKRKSISSLVSNWRCNCRRKNEENNNSGSNNNNSYKEHNQDHNQRADLLQDPASHLSHCSRAVTPISRERSRQFL